MENQKQNLEIASFDTVSMSSELDLRKKILDHEVDSIAETHSSSREALAKYRDKVSFNLDQEIQLPENKFKYNHATDVKAKGNSHVVMDMVELLSPQSNDCEIHLSKIQNIAKSRQPKSKVVDGLLSQFNKNIESYLIDAMKKASLEAGFIRTQDLL